MSWRLPSGKALAEFALQAGFLAPTLLGMPSVKLNRVAQQRKPAGQAGTAAGSVKKSLTNSVALGSGKASPAATPATGPVVDRAGLEPEPASDAPGRSSTELLFQDPAAGTRRRFPQEPDGHSQSDQKQSGGRGTGGRGTGGNGPGARRFSGRDAVSRDAVWASGRTAPGQTEPAGENSERSRIGVRQPGLAQASATQASAAQTSVGHGLMQNGVQNAVPRIGHGVGPSGGKQPRAAGLRRTSYAGPGRHRECGSGSCRLSAAQLRETRVAESQVLES